AVMRTINHEAYHFAQAAASGYVFHRQCRLFLVFNSTEPLVEPPLDPGTQAILDTARVAAGDDPDLLKRYEHMVAFMVGHRQLEFYEDVSQPGDHSVMGALLPGFFAHMSALVDAEMTPNEDG